MPEPVLPDRARLVIVGAGIVGCSTAFHLTEHGWTDVVVLDQGPLFETGGSTSHAPGLVFQVNPSRTVSKLAQDTVAIYETLSDERGPVWQSTDSLEVATTPARLDEAKRREAYALAWDLDARVLTPDETVARIPLLDPERILGALFVKRDGLVRAWGAAGALAAKAQARGARFIGNTAVTGFRVDGGRIRAVETAAGTIYADRVLLAAGIWGPIVGRLAGITVPIMPFQHLYAETEPLPELAGTPEGRSDHPILRHQDASMYYKQWGERYGIGSYRHDALPIEPRDLPRENGHSVAHLAEFPEEHFAFALRETQSLLPAVGRQAVWRRLNGVFSFTPDANSLMGESPEVEGLWLAEAIWVTHGAGAGKLMAEWIAEGVPSMDVREVDPRRFHRHTSSHAYIRRRGIQQYREVYDVIHPNDQFTEPRNLRLSPLNERQRELGAVFFEGAGWERPRWYESNRGRLEGRTWPARGAWEARNWSPINGAEHVATREAVTLMDLSPFVKIRVTGPGALGFLDRLAAGRMDRPAGKVTYTVLLDEAGGITSDLTITRLADDDFLMVDGAGTGLRTITRVRDYARAWANGGVRVEDDSSAWACIGMWGPNAQTVMDRVAEEPVTMGRFNAAPVTIAGVPALALRVSYVGEHGWEIYAPTEYAVRLWDALWDAGQDQGIAPAGLAAQDTLRIEKGYRLWGNDIHTEFDPFEAGLDFTVALDKGEFLGRDALLRKRDAGLSRRLSCFVLDDVGTVPMGREPIFVGREKVGYVTSANTGYTVGRTIAYGYLPIALARPGERVEILYFGRRFGATVSEEPLYDPADKRLRGPAGPEAVATARSSPMTEGRYLALTAARVFDGATDRAIEGGGVLLRGSTIERVGRLDDLRAPDGAPTETIDYGDATILPGFVDAHTHVTAPGDGTVGEGVGATADDQLLLRAVGNVRRMLERGITTARENGAKNMVTFSLREGIRRGVILGPRLVLSGRPICTTGGHLWFFGQEADGIDGVRHAVRELIKDGADWIKVTATGGSTRASDPFRPSFSVEELRAIVDEAHRRNRLTGAHTTASAAIANVLDAGIDMIIHCTFWNPDGTKEYRPDLVARIVDDDRWVNPTLYGGMYTEIEGLEGLREREGRLSAGDETNLAMYRATMDDLLDDTRRMIEAGVKMVAGSDTAWRWGRAGGLPQEVFWLGRAGLSNAAAIRAGTSASAESMALADVAGTLAPGRQADIVVVDGNPLADLAALEQTRDVWLAGRRVARTEASAEGRIAPVGSKAPGSGSVSRARPGAALPGR